jgi:ABC-type multidrug transport system ATPase subunit
MINEFKLEKCQNTFIGGNMVKGISGGERKRTSIAVELITNPDVILLDEPTSGLDSFTAFLIIDILRDYSRQGRTVIFTIHQPNSDIFELFDKLLLMVEGKLIFQDNFKKAVGHFANIGY